MGCCGLFLRLWTALGISPRSFATIPAALYCFLCSSSYKPSSHCPHHPAVPPLHHWTAALPSPGPSLHQVTVIPFLLRPFSLVPLLIGEKRKLLETWVKNSSFDINASLQESLFELPSSVNLLGQCSQCS